MYYLYFFNIFFLLIIRLQHLRLLTYNFNNVHRNKIYRCLQFMVPEVYVMDKFVECIGVFIFIYYYLSENCKNLVKFILEILLHDHYVTVFTISTYLPIVFKFLYYHTMTYYYNNHISMGNFSEGDKMKKFSNLSSIKVNGISKYININLLLFIK